MDNRYRDAAAAAALESYRGAGETLALRTYTARLLGADPNLVVHGGGNTSAKGTVQDRFGRSIDVLWVKGSGWDLATIEPPGHPAVRLAPLLELRKLDALSDEDMVKELRSQLLDPGAPTPSVETLLHAYLPARFIDHTHADAILALADQPDGEKICKKLWGDALVWVPYVMPGFELAKRTADAWDAAVREGKQPTVIVLERHGIFTVGDTAKASYDRMIDAVTRAERTIADRRHTVALKNVVQVQTMESRLLPRIRGVLAKLAGEAPERGPILAARSHDAIQSFLARRDAEELSRTGCATPDHVIRIKPTALFVRDPDFSDLDAFTKRFEAEVRAYAERYDAYFAEMCAKKNVAKKKLDPWPRVILLPGFGAIFVGSSLEVANVAGDVFEHTMNVMCDAADIGRYAPVSMSDLFDVEYWSLEQAKLKPQVKAPLSGAIALVTGAASGIGLAAAKRFVELGAHVCLTDRDDRGLADAAKLLGKPSFVTTVRADVTLEGELRSAVAHACRTFGGLDVLVSNAGTAPQGRLDTDAGAEALRASIEINLLSHNHAARAAAEVMLAQGRGGALLFNVSKSSFNQGKGFGPYAVAKSGLLSLMRQYAVDLGPSAIRSNAINADRIRTKLFADGVAEARAKARGVSVDDYFKDNLLAREVTARDVADAFAWLATAPATTGCVITVDGGNAAAFPR
jgi:rhamnose utilization protein RhaD (predicted bifunctional aldolase and dehydrogenase)/NAD(P)-dependent dehydrogenase (short-subunit alcohol dehydrogenase family)